MTHKTPKLLCSDSSMRFIFVIILSHAPVLLGSKLEEVNFETSSICGTELDLIANNCTIPKTQMSRLRCAAECSKNATCLGSFVDKEMTCRFLKMCDYAWNNMNCENGNASNMVNVSRKKCYNNGQFTREKGVVCQCKGGMIGYFCTIRARSCDELIGYGYKLGEPLVVKLSLLSKVTTVRCKNRLDLTVVWLFSITRNVNNSRTWQEYKTGFELAQDHYWIGLENFHDLTNAYKSKSFVLKWYFYWCSLSKRTGNFYKSSDNIHYFGFRVRNATYGYSYTYERARLENDVGFKGTESPMGDCLEDTKDTPFSTWDNDNDQEPEINLAQISNAGWWFKSLNTSDMCNPLGMSVGKLPTSPTYYKPIAIKNLDMDNSIYGQTFRRIEARLLIPRP